MLYFKQFFFIICTTLSICVHGQNNAREQVFNAGNEVVLKIFGTQKNFDFRSDKFAGRYDNDQKLFEFILPVLSIDRKSVV